ncbi:hypothetical protein X474_15210 [Dethiosulfatarculus sandiegensis]|uniref:Uncharacterized protein n=1 Tax=Dethiosulfatarculus sandiegensis TaxID=1429043 RepID=A0A0D2JC05_9BACT|nr:hypothetical protein X474_15210 [Dethiosulfatarculus sandiegensis]
MQLFFQITKSSSHTLPLYATLLKKATELIGFIESSANFQCFRLRLFMVSGFIATGLIIYFCL